MREWSVSANELDGGAAAPRGQNRSSSSQPGRGTPVPRNVRRALLASRWNANSEADRTIVADIFGISYEDVAEEVNARLAEGDPLLRIRQQRSPSYRPYTRGCNYAAN